MKNKNKRIFKIKKYKFNKRIKKLNTKLNKSIKKSIYVINKSLKNTFRIFRKDIKLTLKNIATLTIILGLIFLPSLYAWFNIASLWDPYGNVENLPLAVYSDDQEATFDTEKINVGDTVIDELHNNKDINWQFPKSKKEMDEKLNTGEYYGAIYFPKDFSSNLSKSQDGTSPKPQIQYSVNQKVNAIAPKMTDAGAKSVTEQITQTVEYEVILALGSKANDAGIKLKDKEQLINDSYDELETLYNQLGNIEYYLSQTPTLNADINTYITTYDELRTDFNTKKATLVEKLNSVDSELTTNYSELQTDITNSITQLNTLITQYNSLDFTAYKTFITEHNDELIALGITQSELDNITGLIDSLEPMNLITIDTSSFDSDLSDFDAQSYITQLDNINLPTSSEIPYVTMITQLLSDLTTFYEEQWPSIKTTVTDSYNSLTELQENYDIDEIITILETDPTPIANRFTNPVTLKTTDLYPVENYGSASASFYTTLCLWVGSLLMASLLSVNKKSKRYTKLQNYFGRMLTFLLISILQAIIVSVGDIYLLHIQISSVAAFISFNLLIAITFTIIIYTLVYLFGNIGKAIGVVLLVLSISGGGGNFPIEVSGPFFNLIYPYLPFTYGVRLLREAVAGIFLPTVISCIKFFITTIILSLILGIIGSLSFKKYFDTFDEKATKTHLIH